MNKGLTFGAGLGLGTGIMYLLDPDRGKRRRALLRDKAILGARKTGECVEVTARDLSWRHILVQGIGRSRVILERVEAIVEARSLGEHGYRR